MVNHLITVLPKTYLTTQVSAVHIDEVLACIKTGTFYGQDLKSITERLHCLQDANQRGELKKQNLPVAMFNGVFTYKNSGNLSQYSSFTALDYDGFSSEEELCAIGRRLIRTPCVYAVFRTPSGRGLKAIIQHDNSNPTCHGELYSQLLAKFNTPELDFSGSDLARGSYLCFDPSLWKNPNCSPYHFEHDSAYVVPVKSASSFGAPLIKDIAELKDMLTKRPVKGRKSDESIIWILNSCWRKDPGRWKEGNRANSVFNSASQLCLAGVNMDNALNYLIKVYSVVGLHEDEIRYHALRGYQNNACRYGETRSKFDNYGRH